MLRLSASLETLEGKASALVHPGVADDAPARLLHQRFILSRLLIACGALAWLPLHLAALGPLDPVGALALFSLLLPLAAVLVLSATGRAGVPFGLSALAMSGLVTAASLATGGPFSPAVLAFVAVPLEAVAARSRVGLILSLLAVVAGACAVFLGTQAGFAMSSPVPAAAVAAGTALAVAAVAFAALRGDSGRARTEKARADLDAALLAAVDPLVHQDRHGVVSLVSDRAEALLGIRRRGVIGRSLLERVQVADRPAYLKALAEAADSGHPVGADIRLMTRPVPAGPDLVVNTRMTVQRAGASGTLVTLFRDISAERRHETHLEQLRQEAVDAGHAKTRFLATVSHELRTPLNAIIGFSEILASDTLAPADDTRRKDYAGIIHTSGQHLLEVVNTLLDVSKIEAGNFAIEPEAFDARSLGHACCDVVQLKADEAGVVLLRDLPDGLPDLVADRRALKQIVLNLLSNAVKFTPRGGEVILSMRRRDDTFVIAVQDTGIGIAESDLERIGTPFFQARGTYDRPYEGTGLGLSVVRGLVGLHHGRMTIETAPRQGTCCIVTLPLVGRAGNALDAAPAPIERIARPARSAIVEAIPMRRSA